MTTTQHGLICAGLQMTVKDTRGHTFELNATPDIGAPWMPYPSAISYNSMMRWTYGDRSGYGVVMANYSLPYLNQRRGRFYTDPSPAVIA
jgi:hypothetical protein